MSPILETVHAHLSKHELTAVPLGDGEALIATVTLNVPTGLHRSAGR